VAFAQRLAQLTGGEVFQMTADEVGRTVVSGYESGVRRPR
jgi:GMP synthase-like glutamine amidotransferase